MSHKMTYRKNTAESEQEPPGHAPETSSAIPEQQQASDQLEGPDQEAESAISFDDIDGFIGELAPSRAPQDLPASKLTKPPAPAVAPTRTPILTRLIFSRTPEESRKEQAIQKYSQGSRQKKSLKFKKSA